MFMPLLCLWPAKFNLDHLYDSGFEVASGASGLSNGPTTENKDSASALNPPVADSSAERVGPLSPPQAMSASDLKTQSPVGLV